LKLYWHILFVLVLGCNLERAPKRENARSQSEFENRLGSSLFKSQAEEKALLENAASSRLAQTIEKLPGVGKARVHLSLATDSIFARPGEKESKAAILVQTIQTERAPSEGEIRKLVAASVAGLNPDQIEIFLSPTKKNEPQTVYIGPVEVVKSSAPKARLVVGGLLLLCIVMAVGLILAGIRIRALKRNDQLLGKT
jgi:type III secretory pathway lipoprotein EscJ